MLRIIGILSCSFAGVYLVSEKGWMGYADIRTTPIYAKLAYSKKIKAVGMTDKMLGMQRD